MPGRLGPRFAIEALFLVALAVGVAYADLASKWIFVVMGGGWLIVALLELSADRIWAAAPPWRRPYYVPASPPRAEPAAAAAEREPPAEPEPVMEPEPKREPEPEPAAEVEPEPVAKEEPELEPEAVTVIGTRVELSAAVVQEPEVSETGKLPRPRLEPLEPRRKRGLFRRRDREIVEDEVPEIELPKHVRLLPPSERTDRGSDDVTDLFDLPEPEERSRP
jgi:hypothetical protein